MFPSGEASEANNLLPGSEIGSQYMGLEIPGKDPCYPYFPFPTFRGEMMNQSNFPVYSMIQHLYFK